MNTKNSRSVGSEIENEPFRDIENIFYYKA